MSKLDIDKAAREIMRTAVELADNVPTAGACGAFRCLVRKHGALLIATALRKAQAEALEDAADAMPDMEEFMAKKSSHPKCVTVHDHYQHEFDGSGDQWPQLEGLWGDCSVLWEKAIRARATELRNDKA